MAGSDRQAEVQIEIDGRLTPAAEGSSVLAALWNAGVQVTRTSLGGEERGPLCAMGVCFECRLTIDGRPHRRACMTSVRAGLKVVTRG